MKIQLYERLNGEWDYRIIAKNGEILLLSEGYATKSNAKRAVDSFVESFKDAVDNKNLILEGYE